MLKIQNGGPIVGLVFLEAAGRATRRLGDVDLGVHGEIEPGDRLSKGGGGQHDDGPYAFCRRRVVSSCKDE